MDERNAVESLLATVDYEFVPTLSVREDSVGLSRSSRLGDVSCYLASLEVEWWLLSSIEGVLVGMMSFLCGVSNAATAPWTPNVYLTTVAVLPAYRRSGVAWRLYDELEGIAARSDVPWVMTRTWSTNCGHIRLLNRRSFQAVLRERNAREDGVDSIYFTKRTLSGSDHGCALS